ncbi:MAG: prepilin-type N-terminal cleavage/methylation domain-containing protein [Planctomycetota bacterium]
MTDPTVTARSRLSAFTLMEVLVALMLIGIILGSLQMALHSTLVAQEEIGQEMAAVEIGPTLLDIIERDLMAIQLGNIKENQVLRGEARSERGEPADRIDFISRTRSTVTREKKDTEKTRVRSPITEVGYRLRGNPDHTDFLELWRRQDFYVDDKPFEGGTYEKLYDRVHSLRISYLQELGEDQEELDEWKMEERKVLPAAIKLMLKIETAPITDNVLTLPQFNRRVVHEFERVIVLPRDSNEAMRVRPKIPDMKLAMSDEGLTGGGSSGGGLSDGGEDGSGGMIDGGGGAGGGFSDGGRQGGARFDEGLLGGGGIGGMRGGGASRGGGGPGAGGRTGGGPPPGGDLPGWGDLPEGDRKKIEAWFDAWLKGGG